MEISKQKSAFKISNASSRSPKNQSKHNLKTPRKSFGAKSIEQYHKLDKWLLQKGVIKNITHYQDVNQEKFRMDVSKESPIKVAKKPTVQPKSNQTHKASVRKKPSKENSANQSTLGSFLLKEQSTSTRNRAIKKTSSSESCELPSFKLKRKSNTKENKLYKKYGVVLPSVDEVLQEQKDLEDYRFKIEAFKTISETNLELTLPITKNTESFQNTQTALDCKDISFKKLSKTIKNNLKYLEDIMQGKVFNKRHESFYDRKKKPITLTTKDLTFNTSMILFTYDQIEFMLMKLKHKLDPEDKHTQYFFQVLLPELCLRIFMEVHQMNYEEAVNYLDARPFVES